MTSSSLRRACIAVASVVSSISLAFVPAPAVAADDVPFTIAGHQSNSPTPVPNDPNYRSEVVDGPQRAGWKLAHQETFDQDFALDRAQWEKDPQGPDSKWNVDEFDDDGDYFRALGGENFPKALAQQDVLRKRVEVGDGGWLTVEAAARDRDKDGVADEPPTIRSGDGKGTFDVPAWDGGVILTGTNTLPEEYRVEVELKGFDFGGKRDGSWDYDGKSNGIKKDKCKTNFPWVRSGDYGSQGEFPVDPCGEPWGDVTQENGYYLLSIMDYAKPAPHNNLFIHSHRKVGIDTYAVNGDWNKVYRACNPKTGELTDYRQSEANGINQIFFAGDRYRNVNFAYNEFMMPTNCGMFYGDDPNIEIASEASLQPKIMPNETYTIAVERTKTSYTTEISGNFEGAGYMTLRNTRPFVGADGIPINHYNQKPEEYQGEFDHRIDFTGPHGSFSKQMWPKGSAYPDNFLIGIPHINYYEGSASVDNLRVYTR